MDPRRAQGLPVEVSAGVSQGRRDAGDRAQQGTERRLVARPPALQKLDLDRVHGVDVRVPQADRLLEDGMAVEQGMRLDDLEHGIPGAVVLRAEDAEDPLREDIVADELEVALGDSHARLRERHLEVLDEGAEERPPAEERPKIFDRNGAEPGARAEPGGNDAAGLRPREHPRDRAESLELAGSRRLRPGRWSRPDLEKGQLVERRERSQEPR